MAYLAQRLAADLAVSMVADVRRDDSLLYAYSSFSAANYLATQVGGGEVGVASGFGVAALVVVHALSTGAHRVLVGRSGSNDKNWAVYLTSTNNLSFHARNGADTTFVATSAYTLQPSDVGKVILLIGQHTGSGVRLLVSRVQFGSDVAITGYTVTSGFAQIVGQLSAGLLPALQASVLATLTFRGTPTLAQLQAFFDRTRLLGDLPDSIDGAVVTHLWSAKRELASQVVVSGQTAPASTADRITGAAVDAMARVGSPSVVVIDPSIEGRRTYGVQGASAANYLTTAAGAGIRGHAARFWASWWGRFDRSPTSTDMLLTANDGGLSSGWQIYVDASYVWAMVFDGSTFKYGRVAYTADLNGQPKLLTLLYDGAAVYLYVNGIVALTSSPTPSPMVPASAPFPMVLGERYGASSPSDSQSHFGACGGDNYLVTAAEILEHYRATAASGRIQPIPGKTPHLWDLTADIIANGGPQNGVPAQVLDRVGTDHLTRVGGLSIVTSGQSVGLKGFTAGSYLVTAPGKGISGSASGFWVGGLMNKATNIGSDEIIFSHDSGNTGWTFDAHVTQGMILHMKNGAANFSCSAPIANGVHHVALVYDGTKATLFIDGANVSSTVNFTFAPAAVAGTSMGAGSSGSTVSLAQGAFGLAGGNFIPSDAEILSAATASLASGVITAIAGKTAKLWDLKQDLDGLDSNDVLPGQYVERVSGGDSMVRVGSPLVTAQRVEHIWSYETSPIIHGANAFTDADYYERAGGIATSAAGYYHGYLLRFDTQALASQTRYISSQHDVAGSGFLARTIGTNSALSAQSADGIGNYVSSPSISIAAADLGKLFPVLFVHDAAAGKLRAMHKRVEQGTATSITGHTPSTTGPLRLGRHNQSAGYPAAGITIFGMVAGLGIPTLAEYQAWWDAVLADERIVDIPGCAGFRVDFLDQNGAAPATLTDRVGVAHMTRVGNPVLANTYARCWGA